MKPAPFAYHRPGTVAEAVAALAGDPGAKVLAGGQSLVPLLSMRLAAPSALVDINGIPDLDTITSTTAGVRIGALARHADVLASDDVRRVQPLVSLALAHVAHATIRNRGTTVGSLVHADAAAEMPVVLTLLGGSLDVRGPGGPAHHPGRRALRRAARVVAAPRRGRGLGVLPGARAGRRRGLRGDRPPARRLRAGRAPPRWSRATRSRSATSRCPTSRPWSTSSGVADDDLGDAALAHLEPGGRHPRQRRRTVPNSSAC